MRLPAVWPPCLLACWLACVRRLVLANLGDSRAVLVGCDGAPLLTTSDHKVEDARERARIEAAGGAVDGGYAWVEAGGGIATSRSFGDANFKRRSHPR